VICGAPNYLAARGKPLTAADLVKHDCIVGWRPRHNVAWLLKDANGVTVRHVIPVKHEISDYEMLLAAVRAGSGLAQLPLGWWALTLVAGSSPRFSTACRAAKCRSTFYGRGCERCLQSFAW
jgi:DNA-binding transcriptional LysR family regulator